MLLFTGSTFTLFFYGMTSAMLSFVDWPAKPMLVLYDGDCGFCDRTQRFFQRIDLENAFRWEPSRSGAGERYGISPEMACELST